jgi:Mn2+/Fe2+ NRAMP family transporter
MNTLEREPVAPPAPAKAIAVKSAWQRNLVRHLLVVGPGLIVMAADNDAGAVSTYTQTGAQYGLHLMWVLLLLLPVCYFIQEMVARLGIATGQGHAAMIFKRFGTWWGRFSLADLLLVNFLTLVTEFAAIALATAKMGLSPMLAVPTAAAALAALVLTGSYRRWERITIVLCILDLFWLGMAWACHPSAGALVKGTLAPNVPPGGWTSSLILLVVAMVGTTIAPWQLFFQQSAVADKKLRFSDLNSERLDTFIGSCITVLVGGAMIVVGNTLYAHHLPYSDPARMAGQLGPIVGYWVKIGVLLFMINAAVLGTTTISLASAWAYAEVKEWPHSLQMPFNEARGFYITYIACTFLAAAVVLIPRAPLQLIIVGVQVLAGLMLPSAIVFLQLLLNDKELLGPNFVNKPWNNVVNWTIVTVLFILSLVLAAQVIAPNLFPS